MEKVRVADKLRHERLCAHSEMAKKCLSGVVCHMINNYYSVCLLFVIFGVTLFCTINKDMLTFILDSQVGINYSRWHLFQTTCLMIQYLFTNEKIIIVAIVYTDKKYLSSWFNKHAICFEMTNKRRSIPKC